MRPPVDAKQSKASVEPLSSREQDAEDGRVERSVHNGRAIEVVTGTLPSGGFVVLHVRVLALDRQQWVRVSAGSFWSFDSETSAAHHGRALAISAINTLRI